MLRPFHPGAEFHITPHNLPYLAGRATACQFALPGFVFMPDHVHLLLKLREKLHYMHADPEGGSPLWVSRVSFLAVASNEAVGLACS